MQEFQSAQPDNHKSKVPAEQLISLQLGIAAGGTLLLAQNRYSAREYIYLSPGPSDRLELPSSHKYWLVKDF